MGFLWFGRRKEEEGDDSEHEEIKDSIDSIKEDFSKTVEWIRHLNSRDSGHEESVGELHSRLSSVEEDLAEIKHFISFFGPRVFKQPSKQPPSGVYKQTAVEGVQTPVQTAIQTGFLRNLSTMERAIVWVLLNTEMKLSYEDIAALLGKERSTIRGQINSIRQKSEGIIEEQIEKNGRKRVYIPEKMRETLLKTVKVGKRTKGEDKRTTKKSKSES